MMTKNLCKKSDKSTMDDRGFTLVELLVVMVILGLLAAIAGPRVVGYLSGAKSDSARIQVESLKTALELYRIDSGQFPTTQEGLQALITRPATAERWNGPYIDGSSIPADPWGEAFQYQSPGEHGAFDLYSFGSDKRSGGDGEAKDINSWE